MSNSSEQNKAQAMGRNIVVGDSWAALGAVGFLAHAGREVMWISGTTAHVLPPLPALETGVGVGTLQELAARLGVDCGEAQTGSFLREFRNKSFREPAWVKAPTPEARRDVRNEMLWAPESRFVGAFEARYGKDLWEIETELRAKLAALPNITRIEGVPIVELKSEPSAVAILGSGQELPFERLIYADRWNRLSGIEGLPKSLSFVRQRDPMGALQALFTHEPRIGEGLLEGFSCIMHKEAGEEFERHLWGYFSDAGKQSIWTVFLTQEEVEDNHQIAKKLRRMKQTLDRMFVGAEWLSEGKTEFTSTVANEQVRFEEAVVFAGGEAPKETLRLSKIHALYDRVAFLTDGYGPSSAFQQLQKLLGDELGIKVVDTSAFEGPSKEPQTSASS